ncbi:endoribonuclease Dicer homolog 1-like [Cryptomeria japonica]|uniref:endoribonuclease Dicer homolog 1-like n=1 Tax=Cryptomeria japonica TaxID=3369 RepID=UPI0025AC3D32|nr:endoribonuclease Dicer homolog 1-like [Cryptomeria japonica]
MKEGLDDECLEEKINQIFCNSEHEILYDNLDELEVVLNYKFQRRSLLEEALTHSSVFMNFSFQLELLGLQECQISRHLRSRGFKSYERLEFVGDAILGQLIAVYLYYTYPDMEPGTLTRLRSVNVRNETLGRVAIKHGFSKYLRCRCDLKKNIDEFIEIAYNEPKYHSSNQAKTPKMLADIVESIAGAVFVDCGNSVDKVWEVFEPLLQPLAGPETLEEHPVAELQEFCQREKKHIEYKSDKVDDVLVCVDVFIDGQLMGTGKNAVKKLAKREAARNAFLNLKEEKKSSSLTV